MSHEPAETAPTAPAAVTDPEPDAETNGTGPPSKPPLTTRLRNWRQHEWVPAERGILIVLITIVMGSLFVAAYSLALGDPVPHRIQAALVGNRTSGTKAIDALEAITRDRLAFKQYPSISKARHALDEQDVYAALDLSSPRPTLYLASAAGASVAHVLERISAIDPSIAVIDYRPVASNDPNGLDIFYLVLVATIIGFLAVFQIRAMAGKLEQRHHVAFVLGIAIAGSLVLTAVDGPLLHRPAGVYPEEWGILALHILAVSAFASLMAVLLRHWGLLPTWLFFVILGNASSGGAVAPPLLPQPFAFLSQWLPSGAAVTSLRNAIYFRDYQHVRPLVVLAAWALGLFAAWLIVAHRQDAGLRQRNASLK